jgi:hypothetical protein
VPKVTSLQPMVGPARRTQVEAVIAAFRQIGGERGA